MHQFKVGDRVRFKGAAPCTHKEMPEYYPTDGTIGVVTVAAPDKDDEVLVQWPKGSTSEDDEWWALLSCLEVVEE